MTRRLFEITLVSLLLCVFAFGQAETGQIMGTVTDPSGAVVPNAKVTVTNVQTGAIRTTQSNASGLYTVTNLMAGTYEVKIEGSGFGAFTRRVNVTVGSRTTLDAQLAVTAAGTTVEVTAEGGVQVNTESQTLSGVVNAQQITELPTLTRSPYALITTMGNVSDSDPSGRGAGVSINGQRSASTDILLDGAENVDLFTATVGQNTPLDSVQEFRVVTSTFSAEYGRASGGVINVVTKSGTNNLHGSVYEFNRVSALAANTYDNSANGVAKPGFTRNQPGYSIGGPVIKNKLFFFNSTEWIRVRSSAALNRWVLTPQFLALPQVAANAAAFVNAGTLKSSVVRQQVLTAAQVRSAIGYTSVTNPLSTIPAATPMLQGISYTVPSNSGAGDPQNTWFGVTKIDLNLTDKTTLYGRYAVEKSSLLAGSVGSSPYQGFDTGQDTFNNNYLLSVTHVFTPTMVTQSKVVFNRLNLAQPLGSAPVQPTLYGKANSVTTIAGRALDFPGYLPEAPGSAIPFGGPQNLYEFYQDVSWTKGKHQFRFGGEYIHARDNRTFGAYEEAVENLTSAGPTTTALDNFVAGNVFNFQAAVYPQGKFPCERNLTTGALTTDPAKLAACTVTLPITAPLFIRHNRYNDMAFYGNDSWKIVPRLTLNLGLRWEYYGVQHNDDPNLDSNYYWGAGTTRFDQVRNGFVATTPNSPISPKGLWKPSFGNYAPRIGFAWDVFGNGKTSFRGGYGIAYERNFGNVTYNVIQNPPNYAVISVTAADVGAPIRITTNNAGPLAGTGSKLLPQVTLRAPYDDLKSAYAAFWSGALEHELARNTVASLEYSGSRGYHLYTISNLNRPASGNVYLGDSTAVNPANRLNPRYGDGNFRGDEGFSYYHALIASVRATNFKNKGLTFGMSYTWSHAIDNLSSTFSESGNNFNLGLLDPFNPGVDKGNAEFDIRHRLVISGIWNTPWFEKSENKILRHVLGGWEFTPNFVVRTGAPFTIFDCSNAFYAVCPRYMPLAGPVKGSGTSNPVPVADWSSEPNVYTYLQLPTVAGGSVLGAGAYVEPTSGTGEFPTCTGLRYQGCRWPANMGQRDAFIGPGVWSMDAGVYKNIKVTERFKLQFRLEMFNMFNHHNFYVIGGNADACCMSEIQVKKGGTGGVNDERRNVQLALKVNF